MRRTATGVLALLAIGILSGPRAVVAQQAVFLVRHAEQSTESKDLPLTEAGQRRAAALATLLKDAGITAIYTSERTRTRQTAEPLAKALKIKPQTMLRRDIDGLIGRLRTQHRDGRVLIVSHSLTIPALLTAMGHREEVTIGRDEYDIVFVIVPMSQGPPVVVRLHF